MYCFAQDNICSTTAAACLSFHQPSAAAKTAAATAAGCGTTRGAARSGSRIPGSTEQRLWWIGRELQSGTKWEAGVNVKWEAGVNVKQQPASTAAGSQWPAGQTRVNDKQQPSPTIFKQGPGSTWIEI